MINLNRNLEGTIRMIYGKFDMLYQMMVDGSRVDVESINIPNEIGAVPIIVLSNGFDVAAKACGAAVTTDESGVKFFMTTDGQAIFLKGNSDVDAER